MRSRSLTFLALVCLLLAAALAWLWVTPQGRLREETHWSEPAALRIDYAALLPALPSSAPTDTQRFMALLDRPLFTQTRRPPLPPPPPKPVEAPPPPDNLSTARLQAIFDMPGEGGSVILLIAGKSQRVRLNASVEGWMLKSIDGRKVSFVRRDQTRELQLQRAALTTYSGLGAPTVAGTGAARSAPPAAPAPAAAASSAAQLRAAARAAAQQSASSTQPPRATFGGSR